jgi:beta-galactosidase
MHRLIQRAPLVALLASAIASGQTVLHIDARAPVPAPLENHTRMGTAVSPTGERLEINSRFLSRNGKPWMPVMGEFHYARTPASQWEDELRKMKAAGIDIVASYVMWNYHENKEGRFDWKGDRDLRRFVRLAAKAGLDVVVRVGPWVHAEVRYGGIPDWVVDAMPTRADDPQYLGYVARLYRQIGAQLRGQLWKEGGPVLGVQIENEYNNTGPGEGAQHISTLKRLARAAGLDVPLYTVTGWDNTVYPPGEVAPVFGGYPDEPWARSTSELPPKETYAFRFDSRVSGDLGAQTVGAQRGTADSEIDKTPFIGAEYGAGLPFMYRRRPVVSPADIASMLPVQLGSGVNLVGYYMFHGGRNPVASPSLEESSQSGGYNDTPAINYDFQAPLGPDGQQRPVLTHLRPFHLFMRDFGDRLAPMTVRKPERVPSGATDLSVPRLSVRSKGDSGFLFVSNHVRQYSMPAIRNVQFSVDLPGQKLRFPRTPIDVADGAYFMWPINFDLDGTRLSYATAQPVARLDNGKDGVVYVFAASAGIPVELGFDAAGANLTAAGARIASSANGVVVEGIQPGTGAAVTIRRPHQAPVTLVVLTPEQSRNLSIGQLAGKRRLVLSEQQHWFGDGSLHLRATGKPAFRFAVYPALARAPSAASKLAASTDGLFQAFETSLPERNLQASFTPVRAAGNAPAVAIGGLAKAAVQPIPEAWRKAAAWRIDLPKEQLAGLDDALLELDFVGDIGRLFNGVRMLDDWYYSGYGWQYSIKHAGNAPLTLSVLPLRADAPVYIPKEGRPDFGGKAQLAALRGVKLTPVYRLSVNPACRSSCDVSNTFPKTVALTKRHYGLR